MKEIERKYLVHPTISEVLKFSTPKHIRQGYIYKSEEKTVRVRTKGNQGYLTIKGKTIGIVRSEFEYAIPLEEANELLNQFCDRVLDKKRYDIFLGSKKWEIDVFEGKLAGLVLAEIELNDEHETVELPSWIDREVSELPEYMNANLIDRA